MHLTETDALADYSAATRIDLGCAWNAKTCAGSYPPTDNGSYGSSALTGAVDLGWFKSWTAIPDVPTVIQRLQKGPCEVGLNWDNDSSNPDSCGKIPFTGGVAGGHELAIIGFRADTSPRRFYIINSWGNTWGKCIGSTCGYAYIEEPTLVSMVSAGSAELDCPDVP